jgi:hypothetical protein
VGLLLDLLLGLDRHLCMVQRVRNQSQERSRNQLGLLSIYSGSTLQCPMELGLYLAEAGVQSGLVEVRGFVFGSC